MVTEAKAAYYAGLFDGEGCVYAKHVSYAYISPIIQSQWRSLQLELSINLTDPTVLVELHQLFGGQFRCAKKLKPCARRPMYTWKLVSHKTVPFLKVIAPYCVMKKAQVEVALAFQDRVARKLGRTSRAQWGPGGHHLTDEEFAIRVAMLQRLRDLKWIEHPAAMYGIAAKSGNPVMGIPNQAEVARPLACVETMGRSQVVHATDIDGLRTSMVIGGRTSRQEIVQSSRN